MRKTFERQRPAGKRSGFFKRDLERQRPAGKGSGFFPTGNMIKNIWQLTVTGYTLTPEAVLPPCAQPSTVGTKPKQKTCTLQHGAQWQLQHPLPLTWPGNTVGRGQDFHGL